MKIQAPNLAKFAGLVGESFASRIDLLESAIGNSHYPSLGSYKEGLLTELLQKYLPSSVSIGTGFVLFPEETSVADAPELFDPLNQSHFNISKQCDIIVYDDHTVPVVFRDGDFVVLRPESVKAVIEVKSTLSRNSLNESIEWAIDFGKKWRNTQIFYRQYGQSKSETDAPAIFIMAWRAYFKDGAYEISPTGVRERIAKEYRSKHSIEEADAFPIIDRLLVYDDYEVFKTLAVLGKGEDQVGSLSYSADRGKFIETNNNSELIWGEDRTISILASNLHSRIWQNSFNRFFSYPDEVSKRLALDYEHRGLSVAWKMKTDNRDIIKKITPRLSDKYRLRTDYSEWLNRPDS